jgi:hypothetical protein
MEDTIAFIDNPAVRACPDRYITVTVDTEAVLKSWRESLFAFEWMLPDGRLKSASELPAAEQPKRTAVEKKLQSGAPLEKPVLGIGLMDNVEIGAGRAIFLTLAAQGVKRLPVHIPKSNRDEFSGFMA